MAIDGETEELFPAEALRRLPEAEFAQLRRQAMEERGLRQRGDDIARFRCLLCKEPLYLSRHCRPEGNRWFVHDHSNPACPWSEGPRLTPDQHRALIYHGQQEGKEHQRIKAFLAQWLSLDPSVRDVRQECFTRGEVLKGQWRRPDVRCRINDRPTVFEIQLSYTFLSDIIERDTFYRAEGIFVIWVFRALDLRRSYVIDEAFFNRRNIFALDQAAIEATETNARLTFSGHYQQPRIEADAIVEKWESRPVTLDQIRFPEDGGRPYFFDYDAARRGAEATLRHRAETQQVKTLVAGLLTTAIAYYSSGAEDRSAFLALVDRLEQSPHWHPRLAPIRNPRFSGANGALAVLLSIRFDRPIGYRYDTVFQVVEAGLRKTQDDRRWFAIYCLWACKAFGPTLSEHQREWLRTRAREIKQSIDTGETTYSRSTEYDEVLRILFPELDPLMTDFGVIRR